MMGLRQQKNKRKINEKVKTTICFFQPASDLNLVPLPGLLVFLLRRWA